MTQRVAVVTGGSGALGTAICIALANAGRKVVSTDTIAGTPAGDQWIADCKAVGVDIGLVHMDVTDFASCRGAIQEVESSTAR